MAQTQSVLNGNVCQTLLKQLHSKGVVEVRFVSYPCATKYWKNLVLVVVLILESNALISK